LYREPHKGGSRIDGRSALKIQYVLGRFTRSTTEAAFRLAQ
jgi:hypothetical protein